MELKWLRLIGDTHRRNLANVGARLTWWSWLRWGLARANFGCVCGWHCAPLRPSWYWSDLLWEEHLQECPLTRNEDGSLLTYD